MKPIISCLAALCLLVGVTIPAEAGAAPMANPAAVSSIDTSGGMSSAAAVWGLLAATTRSSPSPSCRSVTFRGNAGYIAVQTSPAGRVTWGIYMYSPENRYGLWVVSVFVGARQVDRKVQAYEPHGSVAASQGRPGSVFSLRASMTNDNGEFTSVPDDCIIP